MAKVDWPAAEKRTLIGKRIDRIDGPLKATGAAKYSYDINRPGMLWAKVVTSPYAHAEVSGIDTSAAEAIPGVKGVWRDTEKEVRYAGEIVAAVAAVTEEIAEEAARLVKVQYQSLQGQADHQANRGPRAGFRRCGFGHEQRRLRPARDYALLPRIARPGDRSAGRGIVRVAFDSKRLPLQ